MGAENVLKRAGDISLMAARKAQAAFRHGKAARNLLFFPPVTEKGRLADILNRAHWYFPETEFSEATVTVPVSKKLFIRAGNLSSLRTPRSQGRFLSDNPRIRIVVAKKISDLKESAKSSDAILLWDRRFFFRIPALFTSLGKVWIVDPEYFLVTEARNYIWLFNSTVPRKKMESILELSKRNFEGLKKRAKKFRKSYVFGTGPSVSRATKFDFSDGFRIVTNTMINDRKLMEHIKPHAIVFGDFVYHAGPASYAAKFRKQLIRTFDNIDFGLVRFDVMPLFLARYPELEKKLVGLPMKFFCRPHIPTRKSYFVKFANNSLIAYMLPVASAVACEICILGCDGRKPGDKFFWSHAKTAHYDSMTQTLVDTHPSVFRDNDFHAYYRIYCRDAERFMSYWESRGKRYFSLTPSSIPALKRRGVKYQRS
jgi:hypothetical protein